MDEIFFNSKSVLIIGTTKTCKTKLSIEHIKNTAGAGHSERALVVSTFNNSMRLSKLRSLSNVKIVSSNEDYMFTNMVEIDYQVVKYGFEDGTDIYPYEIPNDIKHSSSFV